MTFTVHLGVLLTAFAIALVTGAVANRTHFCTMGAVSDWVNIGDTGRMRSWVFAMAIAVLGVAGLSATGTLTVPIDSFPPYRTANFAWLRYLIGGLMFGVGMTLASGCGNKTLVRVGAGNLKSVVVLGIAMLCAYLMIWSPLFERAFLPWIQATSINLAAHGVASQDLGTVLAGVLGVQPDAALRTTAGLVVGAAMLVFAFGSPDFRGNGDHILGGAVVGFAVVAGWLLTGGSIGAEWKDYADMATDVPSRVQAQSFTFIAPLADLLHYLMQPAKLSLVSFGIMTLLGVMAGSFLYAVATRSFRIEWFASVGDFVNHAIGAALMGIGGVLAMGCTIGQGVTGMSTLAIGAFLATISIIAGAAATMKVQYWRMMREP